MSIFVDKKKKQSEVLKDKDPKGMVSTTAQKK